MSVLTRDEAQTRARLLDVRRYAIDLDLTRGDELFRSTTVIAFTANESADTFVELRPDTLHSAVLDGRKLEGKTFADGRLWLTGLTAGEHELRIEADMRYSRTGEGMHRFTDPADGETYLYTMCCMTDAPAVFACFDQPDLKAVFEVAVTAPADWTVLGNGIAEETGEGRRRLAATPPISTYLMAVAAGPYHSVRSEIDGLPIGLHVRRSLAEHLDADADELFAVTRRCFERYHEIFDEAYPFDSYDQAFVPEFNFGAMENPGLVTFRDELVFRSAVTDTERQSRAMTIAHEMAHMWFGDLVTLKWWDDLWLNESFAEYMGFQILTEATDFTGTWTDFAVARKSWGYDADERPSTHPVAPEPDGVPDTEAARLNFDGISYAKGASALRQLVTWLGERDFLAGINVHFARHRFGNATLADFIDSLSRASGRDVHAWAEAWLRTTGVDTLTAEPAEEADGGWSLTVHREGSRPHRVAVGAYDHDLVEPGRLVLRERFEVDIPRDGGCAGAQEAGARDGADGGARPTYPGRRPDLVLLNDGDLDYAKIRLDERSWRTAVDSLSGVPDPLSRAVIWNAARDMVRDGDLAPAAYLDAARAHLPYEPDNAIVHGVLTFASVHVADRFLPPEARPDALKTLTAIGRSMLRITEDGTAPGRRLTALRTFIDSSTDPDTMGEWLAAGAVPGGPELDPELRWRVLGRLSALGAATRDDIAAERERDPSATGEEGAARCRAALPDAEAKKTAWTEMFESDDLSAYLVTATAQGFWQPEQHRLLRDFVPRYFPAAVAASARRGTAIGEVLGRHAFPAHAVDAQTLRLGEECLRDDDPIPALRRRLADQLDDLRRALRVRDGAAAL
ncbi:aminopeptidase N [Streptomyces sp. NPDC051776]|uniref:aminopeptidase N n=1 Tax=Streptomyces sp. NPDC051776 TaxID=3155414 RepID=UPI003436C349